MTAMHMTALPSPVPRVLLGALALLLLPACAQHGPAGDPEPSPAVAGWDGTVQRWGTLKDVLRKGQTQARVDLSVATTSPHAYGIGALEGVRGEVLVRDGEVWVSRVDGDACQTGSPADNEQATLLALAHVPAWVEVPVERPVAADALDAFIGAEARRLGLPVDRPVPVLVEGPLTGLSLHVLNGACPFAQPLPPDDPRAPLRREAARVTGLLVGFYSEGPPGELTHHGHRTHLHALVARAPLLMGHADAVGLAPGAVLRLPRR